jgi:hypothetical protein
MKKLNPKFDKGFFLMFSGFLFGFSTFLVILYTFLSAYFNSSKKTIVNINYYGEANYEFIMMFVMLGFFVICLIYGVKRILIEKVTNEST